MIDIKLKDFFLDREPIKKAIDRAGLGFLRKSLGTIRKIARNSMKAATGKRKVAAPGQPPLYHTRLLKDNIFYSFDPDKLEGVVGPIVKSKGTAPSALEFGGTAIVRDRRSGRAKTITIRPHPYMAPALAKEIPNMPKEWAGSVRSR